LRKIIIAPTTLQDTAPIEYIEATAAAGYDGIGLRVHRFARLPFHPVVGDAALIRDMKSRIADGGLDVFDLYSFYLQPDTDRGEFCARDGALCPSFGAKYATVMGADEDWPRQRDNFVRTCDLAAQFGLTCSLEFAVIRPLATLPQTVRLITEAKREAVICVDPLHLARSGGSPADVKALDAKYFPYAQISDGILDPGEPIRRCSASSGSARRRDAGDGTLPLRELLAALPPLTFRSASSCRIRSRRAHSVRDWAKTHARQARATSSRGGDACFASPLRSSSRSRPARHPRSIPRGR